ncbi:O-antigen ligase family protein [Halorhodospira sp. 9621]|uniref:O-antigen ligase family protein n=1 Tax=Halorhodospira sp. 9621 TaxID=2899135 RepID=UPI001EE960BD|nr:O-antigen ligase family protein [Halorhodospira sp. 9621]MCG5533626.1 O-antigen ligase family protein [Halorhodospira sp. 9621]
MKPPWALNLHALLAPQLGRLWNGFAEAARAHTGWRWLDVLGLVGVILALTTFLLNRDLMRVGEILMLLTFILGLGAALRALGRDPVFWTFLIWIGVIISAATIGVMLPEVRDDYDAINNIRHWARLGWAPLVAWLLGGQLRIVFIVLFGYVLCWFALTLPIVDLGYLQAGLGGSRLDFGTGNPHRASLPFLLSLIILTFLARDLVGPFSQRRMLFGLRLALWVVAVGYAVFGLMAAQGMGPWLGGLAALLIGVVALIHHQRRRIRAASAITIGLLAGMASVLLLVTAASLFSDGIESRIDRLGGGIAELREGDIAPQGSVGRRYHLWQFGIEKLADRPVLGYGPEAMRHVIEPDRHGVHGGHLHSSYMDLLFSVGVVGTAIFAVLIALVTCSVWCSVRRGWLPYRYGALFFALLAGFAAANLFESYITSSHFWPHLALILGVFYSPYLWNRLEHRNQPEGSEAPG